MRYLAVLLLLLTGCAGVPPDAPAFSASAPSAEKAVVYVYRPTREFNHGGYAYLFLNDEKKVALHPNGYTVLMLAPGRYEIKVEGSTWGTNWWPPAATRVLEVDAGREYYVRAVPTLPEGVKAGTYLFHTNVARTVIELVPKPDALKEISDTRLLRD